MKKETFHRLYENLTYKTDWLYISLPVFEWLLGILFVFMISPKTPVYTLLILGGTVAIYPVTITLFALYISFRIGMKKITLLAERRLDREGMRPHSCDYETFFNVAIDFLCIVGRDFHFERINPAFQEALGFTEHDLCSKTCLDFLSSEDRQRTEKRIKEILTGKNFDGFFENRYIAKDGTQKWVSWKSILSDGKIYGAGRDVTDFKKVQEALALGEGRLRAIFDHAANGLVGMDSQGMITDWNPQAEVIFGWSKSEVIGLKLASVLMPKEIREKYEKCLKHFLMTGEGPMLNRLFESQALRKNGEIFSIDLTVSPIKIQDRIFFFAIISDITERKKIEGEKSKLLVAAQAAEQASRSKSEFLSNMSHEIRTPLNGVIGVTDLLLESDLDEKQKKFAKIIQDSGSTLLALINDILDFSKIEAGKLEIEKINFDLASLIDGQMQLMSFKAQEKGLSLTTSIDSKIPKGLSGDPVRISQILLNLIGNAIKFTSQGSVSIQAILESESPSGEINVKFKITDTGIGLSKEAQKSLFQPFTQAEKSTARKYGGTGLGLSICKRLVELMRGQIGIESEIGHGSTFWFTVQLRRSDQRVGSHLKSGTLVDFPAQKCANTPAIAAKRILIAEDNPVNQIVETAMVKSLGYRVDAVTNGREAIEAISKEKYSLILMDCQMPELDGYEATQEIRKLEKGKGSHLPIVALTAHAMKDDEKKCFSFGMDAYLSKPIKKEQLKETLCRFLISSSA